MDTSEECRQMLKALEESLEWSRRNAEETVRLRAEEAQAAKEANDMREKVLLQRKWGTHIMDV